MAYRSHTTTTAATGTSLVLTPPSGLADGDILLLMISNPLDGNSSDPGSPTFPSGFTLIRHQIKLNAFGNSAALDVAWKLASSESGNYTSTLIQNPQGYCGVMAAFSGMNSSPVDLSGGTNGTDGTSPHSLGIASITTTVNDDLIWVAGSTHGAGGASALAWAAPTGSGFTERADLWAFNGSAGRAALEFATKEAVAAGATGTTTGTLTWSGFAGNAVSAGIIIGLKTAAAATSDPLWSASQRVARNTLLRM